MDYDTVTLSSFHKIKGDNIQTTEDIATWNPVANGAFSFSKEPLRSFVPMIFQIEGTGHITLGIIHTDPKNLKKRPLHKLQDIPEYIAINDIKVYKQKCIIRSVLEQGGKRVVTNFNGKEFTKSTKPGSEVWLAVYVKFGEVTLRLNSEAAVQYSPILSDVIGMNMEFCGNSMNEVRTVFPNPAAICFLSKRLDVGQKITFICEPLTDGQGVPARLFYITIKIINKEPNQLKQQYPYIFTVAAIRRAEPNWVSSVTMEMRECNGQLSIERSVDSITFSNALKEETNKGKFTDQSSELWVALELYRVFVQQIVFCTLAMNIAADTAEYLTPDNVDSMMSNNAVDYLTPTNVVDYLTPTNVVDYLTPTNVVDYLTPNNGVGYLTPVSLPWTRNKESDEQNKPKDTFSQPKPHQHRVNSLSIPSYAVVDGNKTDSEEEGAICSPLSQCPLKPLEQSVSFEANFNGYYAELVSDLSASELCDHLLSLNLMTGEEYETIVSSDTSSNQNRKLLQILRKRPIPRLQFEAALRKTANGHLVPKFFSNKQQ